MFYKMLLIAALIFSGCGKDGENTSSTISDALGYTPQSSYVYSLDDFSEFRTYVAYGYFISPEVSSWSCSNSAIFNIRSYSNTSRYAAGTYTGTRGTLFYRRDYLADDYASYDFWPSSSSLSSYASVVSLLLSIVDDAQSYTAFNNNTRFEIKTSTGVYYLIDLNVPLIANPISAFDPDSRTGFQYEGWSCSYYY